ncbi:MAG: hypothetical protein DRN07_01590 [Thermoplasmata archaeon]|nr:MAG: hypothetical protein DRN07_01590 [Thermoplasmata archaeon]
MVNYCPECGHKLANPSAKFCDNCGYKLTTKDTIQKEPIKSKSEENHYKNAIHYEEEEPIKQINLKELGGKFESVVETILKAKGYKTERNKQLPGKSGGKREIDILATRNIGGKELVMAVECKNYSHPVPLKDMVYFIDVLNEVGIKNALFATFSTFTKEAEERAEQHGIRRWNHEDINQQYLLASVGRLGGSQTEKFRFALPDKLSFEEVKSIHLKNAENVILESANLIWRPFFKIKYNLDSNVRLPNKELVKVHDRGVCIIDALDGNVLKLKSEGWGGKLDSSNVARAFKRKLKESITGDVSRVDRFLDELGDESVHDYVCEKQGEYEIKKIKPNIGKREAKKICVNSITKLLHFLKQNAKYIDS